MIRTLAVTFSIGVASVAAADPGAEPFTSYYAFGDSLSDDGKLGTLTPPSLGGRFSTGRVWTELLADRFAAAGRETQNFALGGSTAGPVNTTDYRARLPEDPGPEQLAAVAQLEAISTFGGQVAVSQAVVRDPGENPLVSVLFGANDLFQQLPALVGGVFGTSEPSNLLPNLQQTVTELAERTAAAIADNITALNAGNSSFDDFLVVNLADFSQTPAFGPWGIAAAEAQLNALLAQVTDPDNIPQELADQIALAEFQRLYLTFDPTPGVDGADSFAQLATLEFNSALENELASLSGDIHTTLFRQDLFFEELLASAAADGINIFEPCTPSFTTNTGISCAFVRNDAGQIIGIDPSAADGFFFGDSVHPTGFVQRAFAGSVIETLVDQLPPVPVPAGFPLLAAGLGALGLIARRKKRQA
ncbi:SGNH/GDSL hydrolase family protein [uncultured Roseobacter sp.]|uniref:SGNH/GDSL hydrolase family protein n=1 Tax=uncultured Roseobacter sp. TaxID=114847 RepID=UPI00263002BB|nr:SGNH/GDSL hydrolase family protein [uncultured Roseobacter sp.]